MLGIEIKFIKLEKWEEIHFANDGCSAMAYKRKARLKQSNFSLQN